MKLGHLATVRATSVFFFTDKRNVRKKPWEFFVTTKGFELALVEEENNMLQMHMDS